MTGIFKNLFCYLSINNAKFISWCQLDFHNNNDIKYHRADSRLAPSQLETLLQSNSVSHWRGSNLVSALYHIKFCMWAWFCQHVPEACLLSGIITIWAFWVHNKDLTHALFMHNHRVLVFTLKPPIYLKEVPHQVEICVKMIFVFYIWNLYLLQSVDCSVTPDTSSPFY